MADIFPYFDLTGLIDEVHTGKTRVPDFQREWVWKKDDVKDLLVSILKGYPIGVLTVLNESTDSTEFASTPLTNVNSGTRYDGRKLINLILDGQQRVTSIYQTLYNRSNDDGYDGNGKPITTATYVKGQKGKAVEVYFYIDMEKFMCNEFDDDVIVVTDKNKIAKVHDEATNKEIPLDLSSLEKECANKVFPLWIIFDTDKRNEWRDEYQKVYTETASSNFYYDFILKLRETLANYKVPYINLPEGSSKERICKIFEKVNSTGVKLSVFDLLTASLAAKPYNGKNYRLRDKWNEVKDRFKDKGCQAILDDVTPDRFLMAVTLYVTRSREKTSSSSSEKFKTSCKKKDILKLTCKDFDTAYIKIADGYIEAAKFLENQGIHSYNMIPYIAQLAPMAAVFATLSKKEINDLDNQKKISKWFWRAIFGEQYARSTDSQSAKDYVQIVDWIQDETQSVPETVQNAVFNEEKLTKIKNDSSAPSKGIFALLIGKGITDFYSGKTIEKVSFKKGDIEIHHIFPKKYCDDAGYPPASKYDTIVNMTPIYRDTNNDIRKKAPSKYLVEMNRRTKDENKTREILENHLIDYEALKDDKFDDFYNMRKGKLIKMIKEAVGEESDEEIVCDIELGEDEELCDDDAVDDEETTE